MRGAGKRQTQVPDRYNPSVPDRLPSILPNFDLSLKISDNEGSTVLSVFPTNDQSDLRSLLLEFHADSRKLFDEAQRKFEKSQHKFEETQRQCQTSILDLKK